MPVQREIPVMMQMPISGTAPALSDLDPELAQALKAAVVNLLRALDATRACSELLTVAINDSSFYFASLGDNTITVCLPWNGATATLTHDAVGVLVTLLALETLAESVAYDDPQRRQLRMQTINVHEYASRHFEAKQILLAFDPELDFIPW